MSEHLPAQALPCSLHSREAAGTNVKVSSLLIQAGLRWAVQSANCSACLADTQVSMKVTDNGSTLKNCPFGMAVSVNNQLKSR